MDTKPLALKIAIIDNDSETAGILSPVFRNIPHVQSIELFDSKEKITSGFMDGNFNSLLINIFSVGVKDGIELIEFVRHNTPHVPICLVGNTKDFFLMEGVPNEWRVRFEHYYKLPVDLPAGKFLSSAEDITRLLSLYLLSRTASVRLRDLKAFFETTRVDYHIDAQQTRIEETFNIVESALQAKQESEKKNRFIIPGFDTHALQGLIKETLQKASTSLERAASVNKGILIFGGALVVAGFVVATIKGSWEAVTFGGFGVAGIVTSLITNPSKSITSGARRLVQIQVAYLGFINILGSISNLSSKDEDSTLKRAEVLNNAISNVLETLEKHCK